MSKCLTVPQSLFWHSDSHRLTGSWYLLKPAYPVILNFTECLRVKRNITSVYLFVSSLFHRCSQRLIRLCIIKGQGCVSLGAFWMLFICTFDIHDPPRFWCNSTEAGLAGGQAGGLSVSSGGVGRQAASRRLFLSTLCSSALTQVKIPFWVN